MELGTVRTKRKRGGASKNQLQYGDPRVFIGAFGGQVFQPKTITPLLKIDGCAVFDDEALMALGLESRYQFPVFGQTQFRDKTLLPSTDATAQAMGKGTFGLRFLP